MEAYDPTANTWTAVASMSTSRYGPGVGVLDGSGVPPGVSTELLGDCPRIRALVEHIEAHPKVAEWNRRPTAPPLVEDDEPRKTVSAF